MKDVFFTQNVPQALLLFAITIVLGLWLGKLKIKGITLGVTWILFVGIILSHFHLVPDATILNFVKDFGLILFVYAMGLQVGGNFFSSLRHGGLVLNLMAACIIVLGCVTTWVISVVTGESLIDMVGVMCGAVTNTPSLGAAQQTLNDMGLSGNLANGYAVAYPLAVVGIIFTPMLVKWICRINVKEEEQQYGGQSTAEQTEKYSVIVEKERVDGLTIADIQKIIGFPIIISRIKTVDGTLENAVAHTVVHKGDVLRTICLRGDQERVSDFFGRHFPTDAQEWDIKGGVLESEKIRVTNPSIQHKQICELHLDSLYGVTIGTIRRAGVTILHDDNVHLQVGDTVRVIGSRQNIEKAAAVLGNQVKRLDIPNLAILFLGITLGVVLGLLPIKLTFLPQPLKLGLAGGPLIVAILIATYGPKYRMVTYASNSSLMMLRELGISLFLASVGLSCGENFFEVISGGGYMWILYGFLITVIPLLIVGIISRKAFKLPYYTIAGFMAGATTDPPALAFNNQQSDTSLPSLGYATVYPISMFLRILAAQLMIILAL